MLRDRREQAAFVVAGMGSLDQARLRFAGRDEPELVTGALEILTLTGSLSRDGAHLHMSISDRDGRVLGGHVAHDCRVRTTAEILLVLMPEWSFSRELDPATDYPELAIRANTEPRP